MQIAFPPSKMELSTTYLPLVQNLQERTGQSKTHIVNWLFSRMQPNYPTVAEMQLDLSLMANRYLNKFRT